MTVTNRESKYVDIERLVALSLGPPYVGQRHAYRNPRSMMTNFLRHVTASDQPPTTNITVSAQPSVSSATVSDQPPTSSASTALIVAGVLGGLVLLVVPDVPCHRHATSVPRSTRDVPRSDPTVSFRDFSSVSAVEFRGSAEHQQHQIAQWRSFRR